MTLYYIIGITGAVLLVVAWTVSLIRTLRAKVHTIDPIFTAFYFAASCLLTTYSAAIGDFIFTILNGLASLIALSEFIAYLYFHK